MNNFKHLDQDIISYLSSIGIEPTKIRGNSYWYLSPLTNEKTSSFKVDQKLNKWHCFSYGDGGPILKLVKLLENCNEGEALEILQSRNISSHNEIVRKVQGESVSTILKIENLKNPVLIKYLEKRKIEISIAKIYCREIKYKVVTSYAKNSVSKIYNTIGFKNDLGGFETRNEDFKRCFLKKGITTIKNASETLIIFEGFIDFLSYQTLKINIPDPDDDFIILNSTALVEKIKNKFKNYRTIKLFLDNDNAGNKATNFIIDNAKTEVMDCRIHYRNFKDLNEYLIAVSNESL